MAIATALSPVNASNLLISVLLNFTFFDDPDTQARIIPCQPGASVADDFFVHRTDPGADATTLAMIQVEARHFLVLSIHQNAGIRTEQPA
jgi:hypothetical protein